MVGSEPPKPRKIPKQRRSQFLVKVIQDACIKILQEQGVDCLSTQKIADVAGVNIASIYQYYENKDAILTDVFKRHVILCGEKTRQRFNEINELSYQSLDETLKLIIELEAESLFTLHQLNPDFFSKYSSNFDPHEKVDKITQSMNNPSWEEWFMHFLEIHSAKLSGDDLTMLSFVTRNIIQGNLNAALIKDPNLLVDELFKACVLKATLNFLLG
ncbi:MAG: TetR/AcrR family transcriptional regulator [Pseudomonadales bacterium]|nr:TetR/AcrR family transcriptional regulator [Pseudomonadales bacterium]